MTNPQVEKMLEDRSDQSAVSAMTSGEAAQQTIELLTDYADDVDAGVDFSEYDRADKELKLDRLADVVTRLKRDWE